MRLLKIIGVFFLIYFIRRFIQMYKVMSEIQRAQNNLRQNQQHPENARSKPQDSKIINADFKVVDP